MKPTMVVVLCLGGIVCAGEQASRFVATLPDGVTVELVGVSFHSMHKRQGPAQWWRPDGSDLPEEPFRRPGSFTTAGYDMYSCEFAVRVGGAEEYGCVAFNSLGQSNVAPGIPRDANDRPLPGVRSFVCNFPKTCLQDTIRVGVSTAPWERLDRWEHPWQKFEPEDIVVGSDKALVFTWPRKHPRGAIVVEITHRYVDEATRLLMYDQDGKVHEDAGNRHGQGQGLEKRIYWYWGKPLEDIGAFEFQKRPYRWVEFRNVALQPDRKTAVEVIVPESRMSPAESRPEDLGSLLTRLATNLRFPTAGRATYRIEERHSMDAGPRVLHCTCAFDGSLYAFELQEAKASGFDQKNYFDGDKSTQWMMQSNVATVWDRTRKHGSVYRLVRFCPDEIVDDLLGHDVELVGPTELDGVACVLIRSQLTAKDKLKVWIATEPDVFPLRIERYEHDRLRSLYEARDLKLWHGVVFPEQATQAYCRWDDSAGLILTGNWQVTVESFEPNGELGPQAFTPRFLPTTAMGKYPSFPPDASVYAPTVPVRRLGSLRDIEIDFDLDKAAGRRLLVCFFDLSQRPSRHCVESLARRADELSGSGVTIIAVQAVALEEDALKTWVVEQGIRLPVGRVSGDVDKAKLTWGIRSLPWLVLTDAEHVVRAEGFPPGELSAILARQK
jgi:hypothetical protein